MSKKKVTEMRQAQKIGAVVIIGGGIAGIQSALDIANSGFKVYIVEEKPNVGGIMAQLDKTFPTNDCSSCMMGPKLVELANHRNIELITYADVVGISGTAGNFKVKVRKRARSISAERCTGCRTCVDRCPVTNQPYPTMKGWQAVVKEQEA